MLTQRSGRVDVAELFRAAVESCEGGQTRILFIVEKRREKVRLTESEGERERLFFRMEEREDLERSGRRCV